MKLGSPFDALHDSLIAACMNDLPGIDYNTLTETKQRRPTIGDVEVQMFAMIWPSQGLGFSDSEPAPSPAYTVIVNYHNYYAVYFAGVFAYLIDLGKSSHDGVKNWHHDIGDQNMAAVKNIIRYS